LVQRQTTKLLKNDPGASFCPSLFVIIAHLEPDSDDETGDKTFKPSAAAVISSESESDENLHDTSDAPTNQSKLASSESSIAVKNSRKKAKVIHYK
jgi:hypothetical protein